MLSHPPKCACLRIPDSILCHSGIPPPCYRSLLAGSVRDTLNRPFAYRADDGRLRCIMQGSGRSRDLLLWVDRDLNQNQIWDVTDLERAGGLIGPITCSPAHKAYVCLSLYIYLCQNLYYPFPSFLTAFPLSPWKWTLPPTIANQDNDRRALSDTISFYFLFLHVSQHICTFFFPAASPTQFPLHDRAFQYCKQVGCPLRSGRAKYFTLCPVGPDTAVRDRSRMTGFCMTVRSQLRLVLARLG